MAVQNDDTNASSSYPLNQWLPRGGRTYLEMIHLISAYVPATAPCYRQSNGLAALWFFILS